MITQERAEEILYETSQADMFYPRSLFRRETPEERKEIIAFWKTLPGYTCYNDALRRIAEGRTERGKYGKDR